MTHPNSTIQAVALVVLTALAAGCASDPTRIADTQVRSADRPECQLSSTRGQVEGASGTETRYDPCGTMGTFPIITNDDLEDDAGDDD